MKKIVSILVGGLMAAALFAGCGSTAASSAYKDGTYKASYKDFDDHGWKSQVEVTIKDGKISDAKFDCVNADGKLKSQDADNNSSMKKVSKTSPEEFQPKLAADLVAKQDIEKVDSVTGATNSSNDFKKLAKAALDNAKAGKTEEAVVENK